MEIEQPKRIIKSIPWSSGAAAERLAPPAQSTRGGLQGRVRVEGKFLRAGSRKLYLRGVTYGPFRPDEAGCEYHTPEQVDRDFALMARAGFNTVRTYTVPPRWLLDITRLSSVLPLATKFPPQLSAGMAADALNAGLSGFIGR